MKRALSGLAVVCLVASSAALSFGQNPGWKYSKWSDPLDAGVYDQFILDGKYSTPPSHLSADPPSLRVACSDGKFRAGEFRTRTVVQPQPGAHSFKGVGQAHVLIRVGTRLKEDDDWWKIGNDGQTLVFDKQQFNKLLTGHLLGNPGDPKLLVHRVALGVTEVFDNPVAVQFEMPDDVTQLVHACGLQWGKEKKKQ